MRSAIGCRAQATAGSQYVRNFAPHDERPVQQPALRGSLAGDVTGEACGPRPVFGFRSRVSCRSGRSVGTMCTPTPDHRSSAAALRRLLRACGPASEKSAARLTLPPMLHASPGAFFFVRGAFRPSVNPSAVWLMISTTTKSAGVSFTSAGLDLRQIDARARDETLIVAVTALFLLWLPWRLDRPARRPE